VKNILSLSCLSAALFLAPQIASAQCTVSTPTGAWGFSAQGFLSDTISLLPAVERASESRESKISLDLTTNDPFGEEGIIVFDGNGHITVTETINNNGQVSQFGPFTGTYSVNTDCTFGLVFHTVPGMLYSAVFVNGATEFRFIGTSQGTTITGSGKRISIGQAITCNNASPTGAWGFDVQGYTGLNSLSMFAALKTYQRRLSPISISDTPLALSGVIVFDGAGRLTVTETVSRGGQITQLGTNNGSYSVNSDCSFAMILHGLPSFFYNGVFVNGVTEFRVVDTDSTNVATGSGKKE